MTGRTVATVAFGVLALGGAVAALWSGVTPLDGSAAASAAGPAVVSQPPARPDPGTGQAAAVARRNVFRPERAPPARRFEPFASAAPPAPPVPLPSLTLLGVMLGAPRAAVLGGLPGESGPRLLEEGERVGDIRLLAVTEDSATVLVRTDTLRLALQGR